MGYRYIIMVFLILSISVSFCHAQDTDRFQSVGGDYGRGWLNNFADQSDDTSDDYSSGLWTWGGAPKGSMIEGGHLVPDPYSIWRSMNLSSGWLGEAYVDPATGYKVYAYVNPYTGYPVYFYVDPNTGKPVYTNPGSTTGSDYITDSSFLSSNFGLTSSPYYYWGLNGSAMPYGGFTNYDFLGAV